MNYSWGRRCSLLIGNDTTQHNLLQEDRHGLVSMTTPSQATSAQRQALAKEARWVVCCVLVRGFHVLLPRRFLVVPLLNLVEIKRNPMPIISTSMYAGHTRIVIHSGMACPISTNVFHSALSLVGKRFHSATCRKHPAQPGSTRLPGWVQKLKATLCVGILIHFHSHSFGLSPWTFVVTAWWDRFSVIHECVGM